jgi:hypothetical protein
MGRESEDEYVRSYWMYSRKEDNTGDWKREHRITFCVEVALERAMNLWQHFLQMIEMKPNKDSSFSPAISNSGLT